MGYGITIRIRGAYALFTRPEMKVERVSYDVITPSAARGVIEAFHWKPAIRWVIDRIHVINAIQFTNIRRNEVSDKASTDNALQAMKSATFKPLFISTVDTRQQRAATVLKDVDYVVEAHFERTDKAGADDTVEKHYNLALRRLRSGQCFHAPCLGTREFGAAVDLIEDRRIPPSVLHGKMHLGWMLYDMDYSNPQDIRPIFFNAVLNDGVLDVAQAMKARCEP